MDTRLGKKRKKRRRDRRRARTAKPQYIGGSKEREQQYLDTADRETAAAREERGRASSALSAVESRANYLEHMSENEYAARGAESAAARDAQRSAIADLSSRGEAAIAMRDRALAQNNLNEAAARGIAENEAVAQQRLRNQQTLLQRSAQGMAAGQGEGGALAMQQAIASSSAGTTDLAAANAAEMAARAAEMRWAGAQAQTANALNVADANAGLTYQVGQDVTTAQQSARAQDQEAQAAAAARQATFLVQRSKLAGGQADLALGTSGQEIGAQADLLTGQLGAAQANEAARLASNEANSLFQRKKRFSNALSGGLLGG